LFSQSLFANLGCTPFNAAGIQQCEAGIDSSILQSVARDINGQHASEWCWAASIEMVFGYYGYRVPQEQIVRETWGGIVNMPGRPDQILTDLNRDWKDTRGKEF
jgi:hypothetical protein